MAVQNFNFDTSRIVKKILTVEELPLEDIDIRTIYKVVDKEGKESFYRWAGTHWYDLTEKKQKPIDFERLRENEKDNPLFNLPLSEKGKRGVARGIGRKALSRFFQEESLNKQPEEENNVDIDF